MPGSVASGTDQGQDRANKNGPAVALLQHWMTSPPPVTTPDNVGPAFLGSGTDYASQKGSRKIHATTWDSVGTLFILEAVPKATVTPPPDSQRTPSPAAETLQVTPMVEERTAIIFNLTSAALVAAPYLFSEAVADKILRRRLYVVTSSEGYATKRYPMAQRTRGEHLNAAVDAPPVIGPEDSSTTVYNKELAAKVPTDNAKYSYLGEDTVYHVYRTGVSGVPRPGATPPRPQPLFETIKARLQDTSGGTLYNVVRAPNLRDYAGINSLVKTMMAYSGSWEDVAPC